MNNTDNTFSLLDIALAGLRLTPHLGRMVAKNFVMSRAKGGEYQSMGRLFEEMAARQGHRPFLFFEDVSWTYGEFNTWANRLAHCFKAKGVGKGDCVALMFENCAELLACVIAVNKLGAVAGMVNHHQRGDVLTHSLGLMKPRLVVIGEECYEAFNPQRFEFGRAVTLYWYGVGQKPDGYSNLALESAAQQKQNLPETQRVMLKDKCYYIFTSGTTGLPKAAAMTHMRWYKAGLGMGAAAMRLKRSDVMYCPLPLYHNNALTVALSSVISNGAALAISRKFSSSRFWDDIRTYGATSFIYVGELCRYLLNAPKHPDDCNNKLRVIVGNGMRPDIWTEFQQRFGVAHICEFYGASESNMAFVNLLNLKRTAGFCPMNYAIVRFDPEAEIPIPAANGHMQRVGRGETGLLLSEVSQALPFDGYTDKNASQAKLLRNVFAQGDCWFNSGDLVMDQGFRHAAFVDRVGDTFRWKGENVATTEVEGVVHHFPQVAEAVVYGVQVPKTDGRAGMLALTLEPNVSFRPEELFHHLRERLPAYAIPLFVRLQSEQEATATFKIKKTDLKRQGFALDGAPVYVLRDQEAGYERLTPELQLRIERGELRL